MQGDLTVFELFASAVNEAHFCFGANPHLCLQGLCLAQSCAENTVQPETPKRFTHFKTSLKRLMNRPEPTVGG